MPPFYRFFFIDASLLRFLFDRLYFCVLSSIHTLTYHSLFTTLQSQNPDELTFVEDEELELVGEGDGDGWISARNSKGEVSCDRQ